MNKTPPPKPKVVEGRIIRDGESKARRYVTPADDYLYGEDGKPKRIKPLVVYRNFDFYNSIWPNIILFILGLAFGIIFRG